MKVKMATPPNKAAGIRRDCRDPTGTDEHTERMKNAENRASILAYRTPDQIPARECGGSYLPQYYAARASPKGNPVLAICPTLKTRMAPSLEALELLTSRAPDRVQNCHLLTTNQQCNKSR